MTCVSMKIVIDDCSDVLQDLNWLRSRAADNGWLPLLPTPPSGRQDLAAVLLEVMMVI